jgi:hypothetical protein
MYAQWRIDQATNQQQASRCGRSAWRTGLMFLSENFRRPGIAGDSATLVCEHASMRSLMFKPWETKGGFYQVTTSFCMARQTKGM